ncbi:shikimate kinase [Nitrosopumilus sp. b3]|uniref:adenylate kinase family protein n=1 Tax=Nitrosopumilus sp. b3 TaxID=2109909 RepID=UPI0015F5C670|nr:AAA family ATPase [Nitrosopumilus sp. b3]KAF6247888.1 shikimate kinase [Nitrosopumilus sp. b3]
MSIVITGNPGVGKHTVAEKIAQRLKLHIIDINNIAKESGLLEENKDVDTDKLKIILGQKILDSNLIVGHLAPYVLDKKQVRIMIVLRKSPYDLIAVYKNRKYSDKKIKDNAGSEILGVIAHDAINRFEEKAVQMDITGKTIEESEERIMSIISNNKGNEDVDWLDLVTKNNDLRKFFAD